MQRHSFIISFVLILLSLFIGFFVSSTLSSRFGSEAAHGLLASGLFLLTVDLIWRASARRLLGVGVLVSQNVGGRMSVAPLWCLGVLLVLLGLLAWY
jgi:hypothetical protein